MATPRDMIELLQRRVAASPGAVADLDASYRFEIDGPGGGQWTLSFASPVRIAEGAEPADCVIGVAAQDFVALFEGTASAQQLFFAGKLRIDGDLQQALKLRRLAELLSG